MTKNNKVFTKKSLREMCPTTEDFLVRIFPHSDTIRRDTSYLSVFSPNAEKYGPENTPYLDTFHAVSTYQNKVLKEGCSCLLYIARNEEFNFLTKTVLKKTSNVIFNMEKVDLDEF